MPGVVSDAAARSNVLGHVEVEIVHSSVRSDDEYRDPDGPLIEVVL